MRPLLVVILSAEIRHPERSEGSAVVKRSRSRHSHPDPDMEALVRSKLISSLVKDCGSCCTVLEENGDQTEGSADGVLTGALVIQATSNGHNRVQGAMRLVAKDGSIVWADTVYSSPFARSALSSFADNVAKRLTAFLAEAK